MKHSEVCTLSLIVKTIKSFSLKFSFTEDQPKMNKNYLFLISFVWLNFNFHRYIFQIWMELIIDLKNLQSLLQLKKKPGFSKNFLKRNVNIIYSRKRLMNTLFSVDRLKGPEIIEPHQGILSKSNTTHQDDSF